MGWTYGWKNQFELVDYLTTSHELNLDVVKTHFKQDFDSATYKCIAHKLCGSVLWCVWELKIFKNSEEVDSLREIICNLLDHGHGYKAMAEMCHPYFYNCPLEFLDMVPVKSGKWREKVKEYHNS